MASEKPSQENAPRPLTLPAAIGQLSTWANGGPMYPIDVAISAVHWLSRARMPDGYADRAQFRETVAALEAWLMNTEPNMPSEVAEDALFWLERSPRGEEARGEEARTGAPMTPADLANLEKAATPGPWLNGERILAEDQCDALTHEDHADIYRVTEDGNCNVACATFSQADADFIVALRNSCRELIGAAEERDTLRTELDAIHATFGGAPSWASVAKNLIDARAQRDAAEEENDRLKAREAEWVAAMPQCQASRCTRNATRVAPFDLPNGTGTFDANLCDECSVHRGILAGFDLPHAALIRTAGKA